MAFKKTAPKALKEIGAEIDDTIKSIQTKFGEGAIMKLGDAPKVDISVIPTGSIGLDMVLNFDMWEVDPQTGKPIKIVDSKWINRAEIKFWKTIDMQKSNYLFYGRGASNLDGDSGYLTRSRYGVKYQIENWGHVETYSDLIQNCCL
jgi:hypothetical protein